MRLLVVLSILVIGVAIAFALVYLHVVGAQRQFGLDRLNQKVTVQEQRYDRLRLQVAQLEAPGRIISAAEGKLGMVEPASVTYLQASGPAPAAATSHRSSRAAAPAGDADWPEIKALLKGSP
jgi:cell division protein FtsL